MSEAISDSLNGPQPCEKTGFSSGKAFASEADGFGAFFEFLPITFLQATDQIKLRCQFCRASAGAKKLICGRLVCVVHHETQRRSSQFPEDTVHSEVEKFRLI